MSFTETATIAAARTELRGLDANYVPFTQAAPVSPLLRAGQELAARIRDPKRNSFGAVEQCITAGVELPRTFAFGNLRADEMEVVLEALAFFVRAEGVMPRVVERPAANDPDAVLRSFKEVLAIPFSVKTREGHYYLPASVVANRTVVRHLDAFDSASFVKILRGAFEALAGMFERQLNGAVHTSKPLSELASLAAPFIEEATRRGLVGSSFHEAIGNHEELTRLLAVPDLLEPTANGLRIASKADRVAFFRD